MGALMVQGTSSSAGKSLITAALARSVHRRGLDVVPFKAQNMSNNARVVRGGEIGTAQYLQALAAGVEPNTLMNPVLVKPEGDNRSQVVILGEPDLELSRLSWRSRGPLLWPVIHRSLKTLLAEHELVLIEGAGSPAETNLHDTDLANMLSAQAAAARVLLVADIDRGGAFAHLYGTWALLPEAERALLAGFVLNKFRGDPGLLSPAPEDLERLTGVPTLGVIPWLQHGLPDEDGAAAPATSLGKASVAVVRYPTASNLDEYKLLEQVVDLSWADQPRDLEHSDLVFSPDRSTWPRTWPGSGAQASRRPSTGAPRPGGRFSASAAASRCWANGSRTRLRSTAQPMGWVCCLCGPRSARRSCPNGFPAASKCSRRRGRH